MCGILGIYRLEIDHKYDDILKTGFRKLLLQSEKRGSDATGAAYVDENNKLIIAKDNRKASSFVQTKKYRKFKDDMINAKIIIGHTRLETQGDKEFIHNNHPIFDRKSGIAIVHNGSISNYNKIQEIEKFKLDGECDSEIILRVVEKFGIEKAVEILRGSFTFAVINTHTPDKLQLYKDSNPLYLIYFPEYKWIVFSSDDDYIKDAFSVSNSEKKILDFFSEESPDIKHYVENVTNNHLLTISPEDKIKDEYIRSSTDDTYSIVWSGSYTKRHNSFSDDYDYPSRRGGYYGGEYDVNTRSRKRSADTKSLVDKRITQFEGKGHTSNIAGESGCSIQDGVAGLDDVCFHCKDQDSCLFALRELSEDELLLRLIPSCCPYKEDLWKVDSVDDVPCKEADTCGFIPRCKACNKKKRCRKNTKYRRRKAKKMKTRINRLSKDVDKYIKDTWKDDDYLISKQKQYNFDVADVYIAGLQNGYLC